jgi:hypothetical protein
MIDVLGLTVTIVALSLVVMGILEVITKGIEIDD